MAERPHSASDEELFSALRDSSVDDEMYELLATLIRDAGHLTIRELFASSHEAIGEAASRAIREAKRVGFLDLDNGRCCVAGAPMTCKARAKSYCLIIGNSCTPASDLCP